MKVCEAIRCDEWSPNGHVQSVFVNISKTVSIVFDSLKIEFRLFERMLAYNAWMISNHSIQSIRMDTQFNFKSREGIQGDAFMDAGDERGFMKLSINETLSALVKSWASTTQHLPWTIDLRTENNRVLISITEACGSGATNARMMLSTSASDLRSDLILRNVYSYDAMHDLEEAGLQWIVWLVSESPASLANLAGSPGLLCPPPKFMNAHSWAKPGKVGRDMALSTVSGKMWMDFAQTLDLRYILFDAGFYGDEYDPRSDPLKPLDSPKSNRFNLCAIVEYGKSLAKPVGVILYVNDIALSKSSPSVEKIAATFKLWGVAGVKMGFIQVKTQIDMQRVIRNIFIFGQNRLFVNVHDCFRDYYLSRTMPHLLSSEGVSGDEHARNTPSHVLTLPFTRLLAGRTDHTFTLDWSRLRNKNETIMFQIALPFMLYNGLQHLYWYRDIQSLSKLGTKPPINLWVQLPTQYEQSLFLDAEIGVYASVARRDKTGKWFLTYVTSVPKIAITLWNFLPKNAANYIATIHADIEQSYDIPSYQLPKIKIWQCQVRKRLLVKLKANSAYVAVLQIGYKPELQIC
ncbi:unnamed protein product [Rotaria socialis]|uniref:Alpha-galactosidase n=1 Tax=Rotaria socialis TaxID=392032 RepID=A0A817T4U8_9BILA|nr:unnamed protein product [Rotaria socialis]CAF4508693.1 unnamed protein product [Rotaria socialis]